MRTPNFFCPLFLLLLFGCQPTPTLVAQEPVTVPPQSTHQPPLLIAPAGYFYLTTDESGTPIISPVRTVINLGPPSPDDPDDPDNPPPPISIEDQVASWAGPLNDKQSSDALATLYEQTSKLLVSDSLPESQAKLVIEFGTDQILNATGGTELWADFRTKVNALSPPSGSSLASLYDSIAKGLRKAHD